MGKCIPEDDIVSSGLSFDSQTIYIAQQKQQTNIDFHSQEAPHAIKLFHQYVAVPNSVVDNSCVQKALSKKRCKGNDEL